MGRERLPKGIRRLPSESLRVRVERNGQVAERVFPLHSDAAIARREQLQQAKAYLEETRRRMDTSVYVSTRDAERTTLGEALTLYREDEGLRGRPENAAKDRVRINQILADNISQVSLAALRQTVIATYRDQLVRRAGRPPLLRLSRI